MACTRVAFVAPSRSGGEPSSAQNVMRGQSRGNQNSGACTSSIVHTIGGISGLVAGTCGTNRSIAGSSLKCQRCSGSIWCLDAMGRTACQQASRT